MFTDLVFADAVGYLLGGSVGGVNEVIGGSIGSSVRAAKERDECEVHSLKDDTHDDHAQVIAQVSSRTCQASNKCSHRRSQPVNDEGDPQSNIESVH